VKQKTEVTIIGAGLSGLSIAYCLQEAGIDCLVVEKKKCPGGAIESEQLESYLIENGPNSAMVKEELSLLISKLGMTEQLLRPKETAKNRFIALRNATGKFRLEPVPFRPMELVSSQLLSAAAKLRLVAAVLPRRHKLEDESVQRFMVRHFGEEFTNTIVAAGLSGVWAADITRLSARSALPTLWQLEKDYNSLFLGLAKKLSASDKKNKNKIGSFNGGLNKLVEALADQVKQKWLGAEVASLKKTEAVWRTETSDGRKIESNFIVLTTPASVSAKLIKSLDPTLAKQINDIPHASVGVTQLAFNKKSVGHPLNGFGVLVPPSERIALMGAIFSSSIFPDRAPEDQHLLTCFSGGAHLSEASNVDDRKWVDQITSELVELIDSTEIPRIVKTRVWKDAIPNYALGHHKLVDAVLECQNQNHGLLFCANWLRGISLNDRVAESFRISETIINELENSSASQRRAENG